jgi:hypothetical protein
MAAGALLTSALLLLGLVFSLLLKVTLIHFCFWYTLYFISHNLLQAACFWALLLVPY